MSANSNSDNRSGGFDVRLLSQLACPVCYGTLQLGSPEITIVCTGCARIYPLIDGIPALIPDRALPCS